MQGQYRNAFLAYSFRSRKQVQNYEEKLDWQKIILPCGWNDVTLHSK